MEQASVGGRANWAGADFELRLGVEFCVYILVGQAAGLGPGAVRRVQLQAPEVVDDVVLEFETGARWAIQAKAGKSVRVEWDPDRPFGKALRQLHEGATSGHQIDLAPDSLDRVELAVDHRAPASMIAFGAWLDQARQHHEWGRFVAASTGQERKWAQKLPLLLEAPPGDRLLAFLRKLYVRRAPPPDGWWTSLRARLIVAGVPDAAAADRVLDVLLAQVARVAPHAGQLAYDDLRRACEGIPGLPRPGVPPFRLYRHPTEDELYRALHMPPTRPDRFVARPELVPALDSDQGVLVAGRPGSGKSHALIKLALSRPDWPVIVVARSFRADDLGRLAAQLRRVPAPYQLLWDDVHAHDRPNLFADALLRLAERGDGARVLAAYREQHEGAMRERVTPDLCRRAGIRPEPLRLRPFDARQAAGMVHVVTEALDLTLDEAAAKAFAHHIRAGDGGPLFALSTGRLLQEREVRGEPVRAADVARLPGELLDTWRDLYRRLAYRPDGAAVQNLLGVLRFLHQIGCPLNARLAELLFTRVLEYRRGDLDGAARTLAREGWLRREEEEAFAAHDVTLEAVPEEPDGFRRFVGFAREGVDGEEHPLGLLRDALGQFFHRQIAVATRGAERRRAAETAASFGAQAIDDFRVAGSPAHLAMALNNGSVFYSDLAGLEETRAGRVALLQRAVQAIEEAARLYRELGLWAELATTLNNASNRYSDLAGLEETRAGRVAWLQRAVEAVEEAARLYRELGLRAELATSLNNASLFYKDLAGLEETQAGRVRLLEQAVGAIEETVRIRRELGLRAELATSLNNASVLYGELAGLEKTRAGRGRLLEQAVGVIEEAVRICRKLGLQADLAMSLNNASLRYGDLAGLEEARAGQGRLLEQAVGAIEEAVRIRRELELPADLAMSLGTANFTYRAVAEAADSPEEQVVWLRKALECIEEAVERFRAAGITRHLILALHDDVSCHLALCKHTGDLDCARVLALCREGEALCGPMEDQERLAFFRQVREQLEGTGTLNR